MEKIEAKTSGMEMPSNLSWDAEPKKELEPAPKKPKLEPAPKKHAVAAKKMPTWHAQEPNVKPPDHLLAKARGSVKDADDEDWMKTKIAEAAGGGDDDNWGEWPSKTTEAADAGGGLQKKTAEAADDYGDGDGWKAKTAEAADDGGEWQEKGGGEWQWKEDGGGGGGVGESANKLAFPPSWLQALQKWGVDEDAQLQLALLRDADWYAAAECVWKLTKKGAHSDELRNPSSFVNRCCTSALKNLRG